MDVDLSWVYFASNYGGRLGKKSYVCVLSCFSVYFCYGLKLCQLWLGLEMKPYSINIKFKWYSCSNKTHLDIYYPWASITSNYLHILQLFWMQNTFGPQKGWCCPRIGTSSDKSEQPNFWAYLDWLTRGDGSDKFDHWRQSCTIFPAMWVVWVWLPSLPTCFLYNVLKLAGDYFDNIKPIWK